MTADSGQPAVDDLVRLLDLTRTGEDSFVGVSPKVSLQRVFGGQVAGQALVAAGRTVDPDRHVHSLHSYFIRPGDPTVPIRYETERARDGRSFTIRRVMALQHDEPIFVMSASFQLEQPGVDHQSPMPEAPAPEALPTLIDRLSEMPANPLARLPRPLDVRYADDPPWFASAGASRGDRPYRVWMRADGQLPDDPLLHACVLTFASDLSLLDSVLIRHGLVPGAEDARMASLDHAVWFHRPFRADKWFLYVTDSPSASGGRGLATGRFFDQDGRHLASVVQEGMIRVG